ncbi:MAG: hypothetical protein DWH91_18275 [Planctomycetota bacterium]|nr:MAG: hypothetical protein DWH91_18275 [Planctomycetota bacterium]
MFRRLIAIALLLTVSALSGCGLVGNLNPREWNRGENYINDDGFGSLPRVKAPTVALTRHTP